MGRDDGVGLFVAESLGADWTVVQGKWAPENVIGHIQRLAPDLLVVVDAADMGLPPGSFRRLTQAEADRMFGSTHGIPLPFLLSLLGRCENVVLIGVQPADLSFGEELSPEVRAGAEALVDLLSTAQLDAIPPLLTQFRGEGPKQ